MDSINAIGHFLGLGIAVFVAGKVISLGSLGCVIAACGLEIYAELCAFLGCFDLRIAVVRVLDDGNAALHNSFEYINGSAVVLNSVVGSLSAYGISGGVKQITLRGTDLADGPVTAADIVIGGELAVNVRGVAVNQLIALVHAVDRACQRSIALAGSGFCIGLGNSCVPLFQNVGEALVGHAVPFNRCGLGIGNDILGSRIDFFQGISGADEHIPKVSDAVAVGDGIFVYRMTAERGAIEMEGNALVQSILRGLIDRQIASFQHIVKGDGCHLSADYSDTAGFLGFVFVIGLLCYGIDTGSKIVDLELAVTVGLNSFIDTITGDGKGNAGNLAILRGLDDLRAAKADLQLQETLYRVGNRLCIGDDILRTAAGVVGSIGPGNNAHALRVLLGGGNHNSISRCFICRNGQCVSADRKINAGHIGGKGIVTQNAVSVGQFSHIFLTGPFHFDFLCLGAALCKEAGQGCMALDLRRNGVVITHDLAVQRMLGADRIKNGIITAGIDLIEVAVTLADNGFPNHQLRSNCIGQLVAALILGAPVQRDRPGITILENTTDKGLDLIGTDGIVQLRRVVIPEVFITTGKHIARILRHTGFNAVADISLIGVHGTDVGVVGLTRSPAVHIVQIGMAPFAAVISIAVTGKADHIHLGLFTGCISRGSKTEHRREAHQQRQKERCASLEGFLFHFG